MIVTPIQLLRYAVDRPPSFLFRKTLELLKRRMRGVAAITGWEPYRPRFKEPLSVHSPIAPTLPFLTLSDVAAFLRAGNPDVLDNIRRRSERILKGEVEIFSHAVDLNDPIAWHTDPASGRTWPLRFHGFYLYADLLDRAHASDVKLPWELSRMQFLPVLALRAAIDGNEACVRRAAEIFESWQIENPVGVGVNWTVGMEAAIRLINLVWTSELLRQVDAGSLFPHGAVRRSVAEHGRFLWRNLEYSDVTENHYASCLLGLLYAARFVPHERESESWERFARRELRKEIFRQTYPDGADHEGSLPYHRLVLEIFTHAHRLMTHSDGGADAAFEGRLGRMFDFTANYLKPDGTAPAWGDGDDGRIIALHDWPFEDHRHLLLAGAAIFGRADWKAVGGPADFASLLLLSEGEIDRLVALPDYADTARSTAFAESGYFVLRSGSDYCFVDCADVGLRGRGGHGHNDALAIEVSLGGENLLVDTGTPAYTRNVDVRAAALSAKAHNTVVIDATEPAPIRIDRFPQASKCPVEAVDWEPDVPRFRGRRFGDRRIAGVEAVERTVSLDGAGCLRISDQILGRGTHVATWYFHLAEEWTVEVLTSERVVLRRGASRSSIECLPPADDAVQWISTWYPRYGDPRARVSLRFDREGALPIANDFVVVCE